MFQQFKSAMSTVFDTISGVGSNSDPAKRFEFNKSPASFTDAEIIGTYTRSGLLQRVIEFLPNKARQADFIEITPAIETGFTDLQVLELFKQASISARLFKEAYLIINIEDGKDIAEPVELGTSQNIIDIYLVERDQLTFKTDNYQNREIYKLHLDSKGTVEIHPSRVLCFYGRYHPPKIRASCRGLHGSIIDGLLESYGNYKFSLNIAASLLSRLVTFVFKMKGLRNLVNEGHEDKVVSRLQLHRKGIGSVGGMVIDADSEEIEWLTFSLSGVSEIINTQKDNFTAETELSHDILWNEGSHSTSSDVELTNTAEKINEFIECYWEENLNIVARYISGDEKASVKLGKHFDKTGFNEEGENEQNNETGFTNRQSNQNQSNTTN